MHILDKIKRPVAEEFAAYNNALEASVTTENPILKQLTAFVLASRGKQMRPILALLVAQMCGEINPKTIQGAIAVELLHVASLIHDDVLDNSMERRSKPSVNAVFENKVAILGGDFLLSKALENAAKTDNVEIVRSISIIGSKLAEGEILQLANAKKSQMTEDIYFEIILKKTATLFSSCAQIGALSVGATHNEVERLNIFGESLGICFQLRDDIFDYYEEKIGKPTGNDIREGKITLPMLYALRTSSPTENKEVMNLLQQVDLSDNEVAFLQQFSIQKGGVAYTRTKMLGYRDRALEQLSIFADTPSRQALIDYTHYVVDRAS